MKKKNRKVIIYVPTKPMHMSHVRKGDLFKILPESKEDNGFDPNNVYLAASNAKKIKDAKATHEVEGWPVGILAPPILKK